MPSHGDAACLPVTALSAINVGTTDLVFIGQGPVLKIVEFITGHCVLKEHIFDDQSIHGIVLEKVSYAIDQKQVVNIFVWGGTSFSTSKLHTSATERYPKLRVGIESQHDDWILDAKFWPGAGAAGDLASIRVGLITMHNAVYTIQELPQVGSLYPAFQLAKVASGFQSILYSAHITVKSSSSLLVASGTVFGEVIVWSCRSTKSTERSEFQRSAPTTHHILRGHQGSIFGVGISKEICTSNFLPPTQFLASCSDDRTIRIWDIGLCSLDSEEGNYGASSFTVDEQYPQETGFGSSRSSPEYPTVSCIISSYSHLSRIWGVSFGDWVATSDGGELGIFSIGEDATLQQWAISIHRVEGDHTTSGGIDHIRGDNLHSGKNIWSFARFSCGGALPTILTGGADGAVVVRNGQSPKSGQKLVTGRACKIDFLDLCRNVDSFQGLPDFSMLKNYGWLSDSYFIVLTDRGRVLRGKLRAAKSNEDSLHNAEIEDNLITWEVITASRELGSYFVIASSTREALAVIGNESGELWLVTTEEKCLHYLCLVEEKPTNIFLIEPGSEVRPSETPIRQQVYALITYPSCNEADIVFIHRQKGSGSFECHKRLTLRLPTTFKITSSLYLPQSSILMLGSRAGALAAYRVLLEVNELLPQLLYCERHVHGEDAVTCLISLWSSKTRDDYFLSCGRDGHCAVHVLPYSQGKTQLRTIHRSTPPFSHSIEGAYISSTSQDLFFYGFRNKDFVLWNESKQEQVYSVECGGAHRSWAFHGHEDHGGSFIWTQASAFNAIIQNMPIHRRLQDGGHGREIKACAVSPAHSNALLLASGAEDTVLRFWTTANLVEDATRLHCLLTLKKHTTGIQHVQWSPCGRLLLSSAGCEELYVWRVSNIPGFGVGAICEASLPKESLVSDLRITHFDVQVVNTNGPGELQYIVAVVYSNSVVKIFRYHDSSVSFELISFGQYRNNCLTQVCFLPVFEDQGHRLLSSSTDGSLVIWHDLLFEDATPATEIRELQWRESYQVHQSSVKALQVASLTDTFLFVVTGGDDNALGLTIVGQVKPVGDDMTTKGPSYKSASLLIPKAHAATITAVSLIQNPSTGSKSFTVYSTGNDQYVKSWRVSVDISSLEPYGHFDWTEAVKVTKGSRHHTAIADIGALCYIEGRHEKDKSRRAAKLAVAGIGLEMLETSIFN